MSGNIDAQRALYTEDAVQMIPDQAEPVRGLKNFIFNDTIPLTYNFEIENIDGSGDRAWMRGTLRQTYSAGNDEVATYGASFLLTLHRQSNETWLITTDTFTFQQITADQEG